ncbi:hypothetical protein K501DRAFT_302029 [Backusella circina FSU 941]|nr:hypothetical protein K501DRAFT_302029 [Backusella circina FSU 941]
MSKPLPSLYSLYLSEFIQKNYAKNNKRVMIVVNMKGITFPLNPYTFPMLDRLPHEVILQVNSYLSFYPKLNLAMTCRKFYDKLYTSRLFEDLKVLSKNQESVMKLLKERNINTSMVKTLHIPLPKHDDATSADFLASFSSVQEFSVDNLHYYTGRVYSQLLDKFSHLKDTIQRYNSVHDLPFIVQLLKMYSFPNLTSLSLSASAADQTNKPLNCLIHTPNLISLELNGSRIFLSFLEELHNRCRYLSTLKLGNGSINLSTEELPEPIVPANTLKSFTFTLFVSEDILCRFFRYIIEKYPNLKVLDLNHWLDMPRLYARRGLVTYIVSDTHRAYKKKLPALMMELFPRLTSLRIEPYLFHDFFQAMSNIPHDLNHLCIYSSGNRYDLFFLLKKSHAFLQSLSTLTSLKVDIKFAKHLYHKRRHHPTIKQLHLFQAHTWIHTPHIELGLLLHTYNGVQDLLIQCPGIDLSAGELNDDVKHVGLIKLSIYASMSGADVIAYVGASLPNVRVLRWRNSNEINHHYEVNLAEHTLDLLDLVFPDYVTHLQKNEPVIVYDIVKEQVSKKVIVTRVADTFNIKQTIEDVGECAKQEEIKVKVEDTEVQVKEENTGSTMNVEEESGSVVVRITCKNLRELHCGNLVIF